MTEIYCKAVRDVLHGEAWVILYAEGQLRAPIAVLTLRDAFLLTDRLVKATAAASAPPVQPDAAEPTS